MKDSLKLENKFVGFLRNILTNGDNDIKVVRIKNKDGSDFNFPSCGFYAYVVCGANWTINKDIKTTLEYLLSDSVQARLREKKLVTDPDVVKKQLTNLESKVYPNNDSLDILDEKGLRIYIRRSPPYKEVKKRQ